MKKLIFGIIKFNFIIGMITGIIPVFILGNIFQILGV